MRCLIIAAAAAALILFAYLIFENFFWLRIRRERMGGGVRIMHITDLHKRRFGRDNCRIVEAARAEKPDIILITGDIVSRRETDFSSVERLLRELCTIAEVYLIYGNHEQSLLTHEKEEEFAEMLSRTGVILLRDRTVTAEIRGRRFNICGFELPYTTYKKNGSYFHLDRLTVGDIKAALGECPQGETLLLAHNPIFGREYAEWGADYTFGGHIHGGSVRLFGIGLLSPERRFFPRYTKGVYDIGGKKLLVSGGLGKLRAFNPPEILIYEI